MKELVIVTTSKEDAYSLAFKLGLNSSQVFAVTSKPSEDELGKMSDFLFIESNKVPNDILEIRAKLQNMGGLFLGNLTRLTKMMERIREILMYYNSLYQALILPQHSKSAYYKIETDLMSMGFDNNNGFSYQIGRNRDGSFFIHPSNDKMQLIVDIFKGYLLTIK